jgi:hypothetical protein
MTIKRAVLWSVLGDVATQNSRALSVVRRAGCKMDAGAGKVAEIASRDAALVVCLPD